MMVKLMIMKVVMVKILVSENNVGNGDEQGGNGSMVRIYAS